MQDRSFFLCGVGGSGMLPLALILRGRGADVAGSDRARDQGRTPEKFAFLEARGVRLFPQDGSGVTDPGAIVAASAAVEATIPDIASARRIGAQTVTRAELLAQLFNASRIRVGVAGTSGKSTTTGMIAWILHQAGLQPTVMNGAVMANFVTGGNPFASAVVGGGDIFVSEVDESDGSIALYEPDVAVVTNVALDHKSLEELRLLFSGFAGRARTAVLNLDNAETAAIAAARGSAPAITFSLLDPSADLFARDIELLPAGVSFTLVGSGEQARAEVRAPGRHNVSNALAAAAAALACGVGISASASALSTFLGIRRRLEVLGVADGVTVIDDFAHNPDKIEASLSTLQAFPGRLLVMFQPHGYGPLKLLRAPLIEAFAAGLKAGDVLLMPDPAYFGGTVDRSVTSADLVEGIAARGVEAFAIAERAGCGARLLALARPGDRIVVMGARDDTLSAFGRELLAGLETRGRAAPA